MIDTLPIQVALYQALTAEPATYPVYDAVPEGSELPYIVIGEFMAMPDEDITVASLDLSVVINAWSEQAGKSEAHQILSFIRGKLDNQDLGAGAWACFEERAEVMEDGDSTAARRLYRAIGRYRIRAN